MCEWWQGRADPAPSSSWGCCWAGNVLLLFLGGSRGHNKVLGPAAAPCKVNPKGNFPHLPLVRDLLVSSPVLFVFQPSKEEANEEKTEDNLTTLFPGQKRRISHLVKQGNVSADLEADVWVVPSEDFLS